jgi:ferredoxin-NADP reductase
MAVAFGISDGPLAFRTCRFEEKLRMLSTSASLALGAAFVLLGGLNVWLVLEALSRVKAAGVRSRLLALHRIGGYLFIGLYCVMSFFMFARLRSGGGDSSPLATLHFLLAVMLSPLLLIKVVIVRRYKNHYGLLMPLGLTIFVVAFALIATTAGPYLARASRVEQVMLDSASGLPTAIDLELAGDLTQKRCAKCHNLDRVVGARKDLAGWTATVDRMRELPGSGISIADGQMIVSYLASLDVREDSASTVRMEVARALVDQRCSKCHNLDRVYKEAQTPDQWRETVNRMVGYAADSTGGFQPGEDRQIIEYLSATQTPEAVNQRKERARAAASAGRSLLAEKAATGPSPAASTSPGDWKTISFISFVGLSVLTLTVRRAGVRALSPTQAASGPAAPVVAAERRSNEPFVLRLVRVTQQTPDAKTLRFTVHGPRTLDARAGQFLTFSFLFDGTKETRCYSICSSPARTGYVEITPKRVKDGRVSVFLNDRASPGMTVEASGPFGQFYLNPADDHHIVLLAAGSGITPMMAMLRYIDDLCLETGVTLLYCVRTDKDIFFRGELDELQSRLTRFRYHVLLSQPTPDWTGARGHVNREFICNAVPDVKIPKYFLCGPPPFMDATRAILTELGVEPDRIRQETFGSPGGIPGPLPSRSEGSGFTVEFAKSGKVCTVGEGQTLLEAAAAVGVNIPFACRQGQCGTCKTRLLSGPVRMSAEHGLDPDSRARGFVLTCVGRAEGDVKLDA